MRTIVSPAYSQIVLANKSKDSVFWREHSFNKLGEREVGFFSSKRKQGRVCFLHLVRNNYKGYSPVLASSQSQAELESGETKNQLISESKTVRVRFLLQKECAFGEQFLLVGDDPMLGSWDPESAVPLTWSDGHVWVVELDAPIEKSIQYKFVLREITGKIMWQPEPDRIIQTWNTANTIVVSEDWEDASLQQTGEEEPQVDQNAESTGSSLIVLENLAHQNQEAVPPSITITIGNENQFAAEKSSCVEKQIVVSEKQVAMVADNISYPPQNPAVKATGDVQDQQRINYSTDEPMATADKNPDAEKDVSVSNGRAAVEESESEDGSLFLNEGGPVLVPGLTPLLPSEVAFDDKSQKTKKSSNSDVSLEGNEIENHNIPETTQVDEKLEIPDSRIISNEQPEGKAQMVGDAHRLKTETNKAPVAKQENKQDVSENPESNVLHNDIQWGRQTLQKLLSNLGFM